MVTVIYNNYNRGYYDNLWVESTACVAGEESVIATLFLMVLLRFFFYVIIIIVIYYSCEKLLIYNMICSSNGFYNLLTSAVY